MDKTELSLEPAERDSTPVDQGWSARLVAILLALILLTEETAYAVNLVTPALPYMAQAFHTSQIGWVLTIFNLVGGIATPLICKLGDMHGKKRVLIGTTATMALGSAVVAVAPSLPVALLGRALESMAIAVIPLVYSLMRDIFPTRIVPMAVAVATTGLGITGIAAPFVAGYLIDNHTFRGVFWFLVAFPAALAVLIAVVVPESPLRTRARMDWIGALMLGLGVGAVLTGVSQGMQWGWASPPTLSCLLGGALLLVGWYRYQHRVEEPLILPSLLRSRRVVTTVIAQFCVQVLITANFVLLPMMVQVPRALGKDYGFGASATGVAEYTIPGGVVGVLIGFVAGAVIRRRGAVLTLVTGLSVMAVASSLFALAHAESAHVLAWYCLFGLGSGMCSASIPNLVIAAVPAEQQGISAGVVSLAGSIGAGAGAQVIFVLLAGNVLTMVEGAPIYTGTGYTVAYSFAAALAAATILVALCMPHGRRPADAATS